MFTSAANLEPRRRLACLGVLMRHVFSSGAPGRFIEADRRPVNTQIRWESVARYYRDLVLVAMATISTCDSSSSAATRARYLGAAGLHVEPIPF